MSRNHLIAAMLFIFVPCLVLKWNEAPSSAFAGIIARLRHECDPANPEANYEWAQRSMPTERKREAIIDDCRREGGKLLPEVRRQIMRERDDEMRGMLIVIAAALGDDAAIEQASREMAWSDYPAVRISAAKTLRRLKDRRTTDWFMTALQDDHFVVNGACGTLREKFYPVRSIAQVALKEIMADRYPGDDQVLRMSRMLNGGLSFEDIQERIRQLEEQAREELALRAKK